MTKSELLTQIKEDLAQNYRASDDSVLDDILDDVIEDALIMANRDVKARVSSQAKEAQLTILSSNIKKATKTIYLQRGIEDVKSDSQSGLSNSYDDAMDTMLRDIIRQNKRLLK